MPLAWESYDDVMDHDVMCCRVADCSVFGCIYMYVFLEYRSNCILIIEQATWFGPIYINAGWASLNAQREKSAINIVITDYKSTIIEIYTQRSVLPET